MKTNVIVAALILIVAAQTKGQGFYIGASGGYAMPFMKQLITTNTKSTNISSMNGSSSVGEISAVYGNFGSGVNLGFLAGYAFSSNIAAEVGFDHYFTSSFSGKYTNTNINNGTVSSSQSGDLTFASSFSCLSAGVKYSIPLKAGTIYSKGGVLFGFADFTVNQVESNFSGSLPNGSSKLETEEKYTGNISMGAYTAIGFQKTIAPKLSVFGEVALNLLQFTPTKSEKTKWTQNGIDVLPTKTTNEKETVYEDSYTTTFGSGGSSNPDPASPDKGIKQGLNFSSIGVKVGVVFTISK